MKRPFGMLPSGENAFLYTITDGQITARVSDFGATLVSLLVPDEKGQLADVVLGFDDPSGYIASTAFLGAIVGRSANRIGGASFPIGDGFVRLADNESGNNLHSGPDCFHLRIWNVAEQENNSITFSLFSPHKDQGYPGNAHIRVTYRLEDGSLHVIYDAVSDRDTVFNMTNHSYFNLAGHQHTDRAMEQKLTLPGRFFTVANAQSIPTGELRSVADSPMDFRKPTTIGKRINEDYDALNLQGGYDHNWEVFCNPCAILKDPHSGRTMSVYTDCPGVQFYAGNYLQDEPGKEGVTYSKRSGICLETQYYPDSVNHPEWPQPFTKAGQKYHSETIFRFTNE
jgi:aldose 1-epimerase